MPTDSRSLNDPPSAGPRRVRSPTLAYVAREALTDRIELSINDEPLQVEQGEREQLVGDVEHVLRRRDDNDQEGRHAVL